MTVHPTKVICDYCKETLIYDKLESSPSYCDCKKVRVVNGKDCYIVDNGEIRDFIEKPLP